MLSGSTGRFNIPGLVVIVICLLAFVVLSNIAAFRVVGVVILFHAAYVLVTRSVPVAIKGRPTSFYLTGTSAVLLGIFLVVVGVLLISYPGEASRILSTTPSN